MPIFWNMATTCWPKAGRLSVKLPLASACRLSLPPRWKKPFRHDWGSRTPEGLPLLRLRRSIRYPGQKLAAIGLDRLSAKRRRFILAGWPALLYIIGRYGFREDIYG